MQNTLQTFLKTRPWDGAARKIIRMVKTLYLLALSVYLGDRKTRIPLVGLRLAVLAVLGETPNVRHKYSRFAFNVRA